MGNLTAARVKALTKSGRYADGGGLYLNVARGGSKSWVLRITVDRRRQDIGLGSVSTVSLLEARNRAHTHRVKVANGGDPLADKRRAHIPTFSEAAIKVHQANVPRWRNAHHIASWIGTLERHAMPTIGHMRVDRIQQTDVLRVLEPIWSELPETARRVRQRIRKVLRWCQAHGYVENNVAGEVIDGALPAMPKVKNHMRSMPYREVSDALRVVDASGASQTAKCCLRFVILTAARPGEARGARWSEMDMDSRVWELPAERMKRGVNHRVPLSDAALEVLDAAKALDDGSDLVFPSPRFPEQQMSDMTLTKILRNCNLATKTTVHGFRSSFRTWVLEETDASWEAGEAALAHALGNSTAQAYVRGDLLRARETLMQEWADYLAD